MGVEPGAQLPKGVLCPPAKRVAFLAQASTASSSAFPTALRAQEVCSTGFTTLKHLQPFPLQNLVSGLIVKIKSSLKCGKQDCSLGTQEEILLKMPYLIEIPVTWV